MTKIRLSETKPGDTVIIAGREYNVLDTNFQGGVFCLAKEIAFNAAFDKGNCNNWATSSLRKFLNEDFRKGIEYEIGAEALIAIERDLTSEDGLKDYGICRDKITLITCDEYRKYRYQIPNKNDWWWTATAHSTPNSGASSNVRSVLTGGSLDHSYAFHGRSGVVPGLCLLSSLEVDSPAEDKNGSKKDKNGWIPVEEHLPKTGEDGMSNYILLSFENFTVPAIGRYQEDDNGGAFYEGDADETLASVGLFVNAWMPLPECYRGE